MNESKAAAEKLREETKAAVEKQLKEAQEKADKVTSDADEYAKRMTKESNERADKLVKDARAKADEIDQMMKKQTEIQQNILQKTRKEAVGDDVAGGGDFNALGFLAVSAFAQIRQDAAVILFHYPVGQLFKEAAVLNGEHIGLPELPSGQEEVVLRQIPPGDEIGRAHV